MIKIEKTLKGFYIEEKSVLGESVVFIGEEDEDILCNQLGHISDELLMIHRLKLNKMRCKSGKCQASSPNKELK